jgi:hypothetical protein
MSSEGGEVYIITDDSQGDEWETPTPARTVITEAVTEETNLDAADLEDIEAYVDIEAVRDVLDSDDGELIFPVESHEVTLDADGNVAIGD